MNAHFVREALYYGWIKPFGTPLKVTMDNQTSFRSEEMQRWLANYGIKAVYSAPYNPEANMAETAVKKVKAGLRSALQAQTLDPGQRLDPELVLAGVDAAWNGTRMARTKAVPEQVFFGRSRRHPSEHLQPQLPYSVTRGPDDPPDPEAQPFFDATSRYPVFPDRSLVTVVAPRASPKSKREFAVQGPFRVAPRLNESTYALVDMDGVALKDHVHCRYLAPYFSRDALDYPPLPTAPQQRHVAKAKSFGGARTSSECWACVPPNPFCPVPSPTPYFSYAVSFHVCLGSRTACWLGVVARGKSPGSRHYA